MTRAEFEQKAAASRGTTVDGLHAGGMFAAPCSCGAGFCRGWVLEIRVHS